MNVAICQRQRARRVRYRPAGERIDRRLYEVARIPRWEAGLYVKANHYAGSFPAEILSFGFYRRGGHLVGVATVSQPMSEAVLDVIPGSCGKRAELGRFVLDDDVPGDGESVFLAEMFRQLAAEGYAALVSFADPMPRRTASGDVVFPGHIGTIYQAVGAPYLGRSTPHTQKVLVDGRVLSPRSIQKIRGRERGNVYAVEQIRRAGAAVGAAIPELREEAGREEARAWLRKHLSIVARNARHPGNLRYLLPVDRAVVRALPPALSLPYPTARLIGGALILEVA